MGRRMATNLARSLHASACPPLQVWNRSSDGVTKFEKWASEREAHESSYVVVKDLADIVKE